MECRGVAHFRLTMFDLISQQEMAISAGPLSSCYLSGGTSSLSEALDAFGEAAQCYISARDVSLDFIDPIPHVSDAGIDYLVDALCKGDDFNTYLHGAAPECNSQPFEGSPVLHSTASCPEPVAGTFPSSASQSSLPETSLHSVTSEASATPTRPERSFIPTGRKIKISLKPGSPYSYMPAKEPQYAGRSSTDTSDALAASGYGADESLSCGTDVDGFKDPSLSPERRSPSAALDPDVLVEPDASKWVAGSEKTNEATLAQTSAVASTAISGQDGGSRICRIDTCTSDVSGETTYYKRRRVCRACVRAPSLLVNGKEARFCQQCSQLHLVEEFDGSKRSCRSKLAMHRIRVQSTAGSSAKSTRFGRSVTKPTSRGPGTSKKAAAAGLKKNGTVHMKRRNKAIKFKSV